MRLPRFRLRTLMIVIALEAIGYAGYASAEILPNPDSDTAARQPIDAFRRFFGRATK